MLKPLKWDRIDTSAPFNDGRKKLRVLFSDDEDERYDWAPKWEQVFKLFRTSLEVENLNTPSSVWIKEFAITAKEVFDRCSGQIAEAYMQVGWVTGIRQNKLVLSGNDSDSLYPVAFELTEDWLRDWLNTYVQCLVINGVVAQVSQATRPQVNWDDL